MRENILMPQLGESVSAGTLVGWLRHPGEYIEAGDVLFEVETDKATMEVEAETSGYVRQIFYEEGQDVKAGDVVALMTTTSDEPLE